MTFKELAFLILTLIFGLNSLVQMFGTVFISGGRYHYQRIDTFNTHDSKTGIDTF